MEQRKTNALEPLRAGVTIVILSIVFGLFASFQFRSSGLKEEICISKEEQHLYDMMMDYRKAKHLPAIPLSYSLTQVAKIHAKDLMENNLVNDDCNMHSWSAKGKWTSCCYYPDHRNKECMWNKPRELSSYVGDGYEIAFFKSDGADAATALMAWKQSKAHNPVVVNLGMWKPVQWNAVGVAVYGNYAIAWFGMVKDSETAIPMPCH